MKITSTAISIAAIIMTVMVLPYKAGAHDTKGLISTNYEKTARGGLLYDNWAKVLGVRTEGTHPSYPAEGKMSGGSTWRCKECHGWDYLGKAGAYSGGSHFSGIKGIQDYEGKDPKDIVKILGDKTHALGAAVTEDAIEELAYFVSYGQIDVNAYINPQTKKAAGDLINGAKIYSSICAKCHGADGKKINFKTEKKPEYLGTLAGKNPWEALHKIRFGQPSSDMPALLFLDIKDQIDVLSYCQGLPER